MKIFRLCLGVWLLSLAGLSAQVTVEVVPQQEQFLPGEALPVAARITNLSGQSLHLGEDAGWLTFTVESREGFIVNELEKVPVQGAFTLDSSKVATKRVDLAPCFNLTKPGRYNIIATVKVGEWGQEFSSNPKPFDIIKGAKLWEQEFGVPPRAGKSDGPEMRKYGLQQANYLKQLRLYARITDTADSRVFRVFSLGPLISFSQPEPQVDSASNLHVLWQIGARAFAYCVVNPDGELLVRQTYDIEGSRPKLRVGEDGKIIVAGGVRRVTREDIDLPAPPKPVVTNEVAVPKI